MFHTVCLERLQRLCRKVVQCCVTMATEPSERYPIKVRNHVISTNEMPAVLTDVWLVQLASPGRVWSAAQLRSQVSPFTGAQQAVTTLPASVAV